MIIKLKKRKYYYCGHFLSLLNRDGSRLNDDLASVFQLSGDLKETHIQQILKVDLARTHDGTLMG